MRILFTISVVAFVALLWASVSTAQYIRRTRARRKLLEEFAAEHAARLAEPPSGFAPVKILAVPEPVVIREPVTFANPAAVKPPPIPEPVAEVPPPPMPETVEAHVVEAPFEARWPLARHRASSAAVPIFAEPSPEPVEVAEAQAPEPASMLKRPPASVTQRPYSAYFSDDMGDLSDPEPGSSRFSRFKERFKHS